MFLTEQSILERFSHSHPMVKLFKQDGSIYAYDAKSALLTQVLLEDLYQLVEHDENPEYQVKEHIQKLIDCHVLSAGVLKKIVPDDSEIGSLIETQLNSYIPRKFSLEVTEACTLRCSYCMYTNDISGKRKHTSARMSEETAVEAIDYYFKTYTAALQKLSPEDSRSVLQIAVPGISWWGGEPLLNFDLIKYSYAYFESLPWNQYGVQPSDFRYSVVSNLTVLTDEMMDFIARDNFYLFVSLDGSEKEHDVNRIQQDGTGSFKRVLANLDRLIEKYPEFCREHLIVQSVKAENIDTEAARLFIEQYFGVNTSTQKILKYLRFEEKREKRYLSTSAFYDIDEQVVVSKYFSTYKKLATLSEDRLKEVLKSNESLSKDFERLISLEKSLIFDMPQSSEVCVKTFSCPIGVDMVFFSCNGDMHICNKVDYSYPIGHVKRGIDKSSIYLFYKKYFAGIRKKCIGCWAFRFCKVCPANVYFGDQCYYPTDEECCQLRKNVSLNISKYICLSENFDVLLDRIRSLFLNKKVTFLDYEGPIILNTYRHEKD